MKWLYLILGIIVFTFLLNIMITWSYNILFAILKKPVLWLIVMFAIGFLTLFLSSYFKNALVMISIAAFLAFLLKIPPKNKDISRDEIDKLCDEYAEVKNSRIKYRIGLGLYVTGCIFGQVIGYAQIT